MMKMVKAIFKKYCWGLLGGLIGMGIVDIYNKTEFSVSNWLLRIVIFVVIYFIMGTVEYKSGKLK